MSEHYMATKNTTTSVVQNENTQCSEISPDTRPETVDGRWMVGWIEGGQGGQKLNQFSLN